MRTARRIICAISILLVVFFVFACNNDYGVFSNIQQEKKQSGNTIFQKTPVNNVFKLGSSYYAATRRLQTRDVATSSLWSVVTIGGSSNYDLRSAALAGNSTTGTIYALIEATDGTQSVYHWTSGDTSWTAIATLPTPGLDALFATSNGELYAEGHSYNSSTLVSTYFLFHLVGTSLNNPMLGFTPTSDKSIRGVVSNLAGTKFWIASEDQLVSNAVADGSGTIVNEISITYPTLSGKTIWGISFTTGIADASSLYITTKDGYLYKGGTPAGSLVVSLPLTQVVQVPNGASDNILVGTDAIGYSTAVGYYEGTFGSMVSGSAGKVTLSNGIYTSTVSTFPVHAFFYDSTAQKVFICVSPGTASLTSYGLYSSDWNGSTWSGWSAE